jgi:TolB-like protein/Tfp pilus assembly protein PilF
MKPKATHWLLAGVLLSAAAFVAGYTGLVERLRGLTKRLAEPATVAASSIAILPFTVEGASDSTRYLSEGLPQELIASLSRLEGLKMIGRTSSFQVPGQGVDARVVGPKLGVVWLLEGNLSQTGNQLRVSVQLVNPADGSRPWSQTFDHPLEGLIATEADIASAVARQIGIAGVGDNARLLQTPPHWLPSNGAAAPYLALLQGDFHAARDTESDLRQAITLYDEATRLDPAYAMAYARLSLAQSNLSAEWLTGSEVATANSRATTAAQTALRLAPELSEAHEALANVEFVTAYERPEPGVELRRAVELAPADAEPKVRLGEWLAARGDIQQGLTLLREALVTDPLYMQAYLRIGMALSGLGRYDEAEAVARKALDLTPAAPRFHLLLADLALARGNVPEAAKEAQLESEPFWREYALAQVAQLQSDTTAADKAVSSYISRHSLADASQIAALYALRKDPDRMFEWLNRAVTERDSGVFWWMLGQPFLVAYRDDPRFGALCVRLGIDPSALHR